MKSSVVPQQPLWLKDRLKVKGMMVAVVFVRRAVAILFIGMAVAVVFVVVANQRQG